MRTKEFWLDTLERAFKTAAQSMLTIVMVDTVIWEINWVEGRASQPRRSWHPSSPPSCPPILATRSQPR